MKECSACKHFRKGTYSLWCENPKNGYSTVTGQVKARWAHTVRDDESRCGAEGTWFEKSVPVPTTRSWLRRWIASKF